jgi:ankyrin repeat protein
MRPQGVKIAQLLLENGADPEILDPYGDTALGCALCMENPKMV